MSLSQDLWYVHRHRFLRHLLVMAVAIAVLGPLVARVLIHPLFEEFLVRNTEAEAVRVGDFLGSRLGVPDIGLAQESLPEGIDGFARDAARHLRLAKLKIFSPGGEVIYSTDGGDIGAQNEHAYFRQRVARGEVYTKVVRKADRTLEGQTFEVDVVETYVPVMNAEGAFAGAFETYYDITDRLAELERLVDYITVATVVTATALLAVVILLLGRAGRAAEERARAEQRFRALNRRHQMILDTAGEGIFGVDTKGRFGFANPAALRMMGWPADELMGGSHHQLVHHTKVDGSPNPPGDCPVHLALDDQRLQRGDNEVFWRKDGTSFPVDLTAAPLVDDGQVSGAVVVFRDISRRVEAERALQAANAKLEALARIDGLTGVFNRRTFDELLASAWLRHARDREPLSLLLADVDYFKAYNDSLGHQAGDECLRRLAPAIAEQVYRPADVVARYGGEEFAVVLMETGSEGAAHVADRILDAIATLELPHPASPVADRVTLSVGVATALPSQGGAPAGLVRAADEALYAAKGKGRNCIVIAPVVELGAGGEGGRV